MMRLFSGSSHPLLATALAKELGTTCGPIHLKAFSCGERYVKFGESVRGKDVYIVQTGSRNPNEDLMELFLMCQAATLSFASSVHVVMPHFPYARQDRVAEPREAISAKLVASLLETAGADHIITLDLHSQQIQGFFSIPVDSLDGRTIFAEYIRKKNLKNPIVIAPDAGGAKRAKKLADLIGAELGLMHKHRAEHQKAEILEVIGNLDGRTCIILDDMIDTGGSMIPAKEALLKRGANPDIYAAVTHPVFSGNAVENLQKAGFKELIVTDSIPLPTPCDIPGLTVLTIAPMLARVIQSIETGESVTKIYAQAS